jgi:hypothetical protein
MEPEAVEGLPVQDIFPEGSFPSEPLAAVGSGELTNGNGEAIHQSEGRVVLDQTQKLLPNLLLDLPEVGGLPGESGSMHSLQAGKEVPIMLAEIAVQFRVLAAAQEFSHCFHGQNLGVRQSRRKSALPQVFPSKKALQRIIDQAKD